MELFSKIPEDLFSVLASPNKRIYAKALDVLYDIYYQDDLRIWEDNYYEMLRSNMEFEIADADFTDEEIYAEELKDLSGKVRFVIRKLYSKGWFEKDRGKNFEEYIIVPNYSSVILEVLHELQSEKLLRGDSHVFETYSTLKVANEMDSVNEKMLAVYSAYEHTFALTKMLKTVYHNIKSFIKLQIEMKDLDEVLSSHFDDFAKEVMEAYIIPLKIRDSVPKYKGPIKAILNEWIDNEDLLSKMADAALMDKRGSSKSDCYYDILGKLTDICEKYDSFENKYLNEIDDEVRRYTRATTQKIQYLTNRDKNICGYINKILTELSKNKRSDELTVQVNEKIDLFEQQYISEKSLWYRKNPIKRNKSDRIYTKTDNITDDMKNDAKKILHTRYGKRAVYLFMKDFFGDEQVKYSRDLKVINDESYIMAVLSIVNADEKDSFYKIERLDGIVKSCEYTLPNIKYVVKGEK